MPLLGILGASKPVAMRKRKSREANGATDKTGKVAPHKLADETAKSNEGRRVETTGA